MVAWFLLLYSMSEVSMRVEEVVVGLALLSLSQISADCLAQPNSGMVASTPSCATAAGAAGLMHPVRSANLQVRAIAGNQFVSFHGGSKVEVRLGTSWASRATPTQMRVYWKRQGTGSFKLLCRVQLRPGNAVAFEVDSQSPLPRSSWRVEFDTSAAAPGETGRVDSLDFVDELEPDVLAERDADLWERKSSAMCHSGAHGWTGADRKNQYFGGKAALQIVFSKEVISSDAARDQLTNALLSAVTLWADACVVCRVDHLAVVTVNGRPFVKESLESWRWWLSRHRPYTLAALTAAERDLAAAFEPAYTVNALDGSSTPVRNLSTYRPASDELLKEICALPKYLQKLPLISTSQAALCNPASLTGASSAKVIIEFVNGQTFCGDSDNIIACRADHELTEYNIRDYRFVTVNHGKTESLIGTGRVEVDLLHAILHEMGHWLGLPHLHSPETIMSGSLETSRCIDDRTIAALRGLLKEVSPAAGSPMPFTLRAQPP